MITNKEVRISVNRTLSKKLIYIIAAVTLLAMMIPAMAIPVSAQGETVTLTLVDPLTGSTTTADGGYNITGSKVLATANFVPDSWNLLNFPGASAVFVGPPPAGSTTANVTGVWGEALIQASTSGNLTISADKKWGQIKYTDITLPGISYVTWSEADKKWTGNATITDTVYGDFVNKEGIHSTNPMQGAILNWYLVSAYSNIPMGPAEAGILKDAVASSSIAKAKFVGIDEAAGATTWRTVSGIYGTSTIHLSAWGEEAIKIVVVPEYPGNPQIVVNTEITSWNFQTREMEVVPQVRWAGEKIVLEKNYGVTYHPESVRSNPLYLVRFSTTCPDAVLEAFGNTYIPLGGGNFSNTPQSVWTTVQANGLASVVLYYPNQGQVDVVSTLYAYSPGNDSPMAIDNQHAFMVYYMKLESLSLGDVVGKRANHYYGRWTPANPFDTSFISGNTTDMNVQTLNVSQDALERARVKGWFMAANLSTRAIGYQDQDGDGVNDITLPAGRWVLPDDWNKLAGNYNWQQRRIHWDIMDAPNDNVTTTVKPTNAYLTGQYTPVQGPFSPGIELMTPTGWELGKTSPDTLRDMKTVVPNGALDAWDAPMPPAKIIFEITQGAGYFKQADKSYIYYLMDGTTVRYTTPFYQSMIPAHQAIPAFINNGGYDWASFDSTAYGPYCFWNIINRPDAAAKVPTSDWANRPTKVEVYSDNHGEAMVFLNGDWNLDLTPWIGNTGYDVQPGAAVATSKVQAMADYPYIRGHQPIASTQVEKIWTWGKYILGSNPQKTGQGYANGTIDPATYRMVLQTGSLDLDPIINGVHVNTGRDPEDRLALSDKKMAWIWVCDRDGLRDGATGWSIDWYIQTQGAVGVHIPPTTSWIEGAHEYIGISGFNDITKHIYLEDGFLKDTHGQVTNLERTAGNSITRAPTDWEAQLFNKYYSGLGLQSKNFAVAAVEVMCNSGAQVDLTVYIHSPREGLQIRHTNLDFSAADRADDPLVLGDANFDGIVNMGDVVSIERMILGLTPRVTDADTNVDGSIDMGDVVRSERTILLGQ